MGIHEYKAVLRTYDVFSTNYTDTNRIQNWQAHFFQCKHCKVRHFETTHTKYSTHTGIDRAKHDWLDNGVIHDCIRNPHKYQNPEPKKPSESNISGLTMSDKVAKMLVKALDTSSESEADACFRMARKAYKNGKSETA